MVSNNREKITRNFFIGGLIFAGYYYKDKILKKNTEQQTVRLDEQAPKQTTKDTEQDMGTEEELIHGNYDQLVLTENDIKPKYPFLSLENSKEIKNFSELNFLQEVNMPSNIAILGGHSNHFGIKFENIDSVLEQNISIMNTLTSEVFVFSSINEAKASLNNIMVEMQESDPDMLVQDIDLGEGGIKIIS